ncbi:helix-turn-helix transcriptional regulator [Microbacterium sp. TPU 3598]|uniref:helix-turn-helix transcriptional regulator n=1 Tax=Microbacterium sp. TPU 3598 TaxID=1938334 RepID=UPI0012FDCA53|nr:LuxR family transcriptional regulator [Microbacterium sp. TPU 3598]
MSRNEQFLTAVDILQSSRSVEVTGEHGSGRTHLLQRIRDHFVTLGWRVVELPGQEPFRRSQLVALALAGIATTGNDPRVSPLVTAYRSLLEQVAGERTVVLVDDSDSMDDGSWGIITAVSAAQHAPVAYTRVPHRPAPPAGALAPVYSIDLLPLSYAELEAAVEASWSLTIEPNTMSRVFAKSGGNIGIAHLILDAARRAGRLTEQDGIARAVGSLWVPTLRAVVDRIMEPLDAHDISALQALSLLGTVDIETAVKVVSQERLIALEGARFVSVVPFGGRRMLTVNPPLIVEYFRTQAQPAQYAAILAKIGDSLHGEAAVQTTSADPRNTSSHVRVVHEQIRMRAVRAREAWHAHPTVAHATALLQAMQADSAHIADEVDTLAVAVGQLAAPDEDWADWESAYWSHVAQHQGDVERALEGLATAENKYPAEAVRLRATRLLLQMALVDVPEEEPFAEVDTAVLAARDVPLVLMVRVGWHLIRGDAVRAHELITVGYDDAAPIPELDALQVYCELGLDRYELASELAEERLEKAHAAFDATNIRVYSYLVALCGLVSRRLERAETIISEAAALGLPPGQAPLSYVGLTLMGAYFAIRRGQRGQMAQFLAELDETGLPDGTLPGQNRAFIKTRLALLESDTVAAARVSRESGDALWERGARLAAGHCYLDSVNADLRPGDWAHAKHRLDQLNSPTFARAASVYDAMMSGDMTSTVEQVKALAEVGRRGEAAYYARAALRIFTADDADTQRTRELLSEVIDAAPVSLTRSGVPELTAREREVAELVASGLTNPMIADALVVSVRTVESHVNKLMRKIGVKRRTDVREYLLASGARG